MPHRREVDPDLVSSARYQVQLEEARAVGNSDDTEAGCGFLARPVDLHLSPIGGLASERRRDKPGLVGERAFDQRQVRFGNRAVGKLFDEAEILFVGPRDQDDPAGVHV